MTIGRGRRILSIQSSVCSGYVGNRAATFPLQLLGYDVSCINTVQFSTHTGYPNVKGQKLSPDDIHALFSGLENQVDTWEGLLTGYVPGVAIESVIDVAKTLKKRDTKILWVLDPVMGDEERGLYVSEDIPKYYRSLVGQADIITPNQFELQELAEMQVSDMQSLKLAMSKVHGMGVERIVVTTFRDAQRPEKIIIVGSGPDGMFEIEADYRARPYQGTGDLFAALLMAHSLAGESLKDAVVKLMDSMKPVLDLTGQKFDEYFSNQDWVAEKAKGRAADVCRACELRIIEGADAILHPKSHYSASVINA